MIELDNGTELSWDDELYLVGGVVTDVPPKDDGKVKPTYRADPDKLRNLPDHIKSHPFFCLWKWTWRDKEQKWSKVPYNPRTGKGARSNDPSTFAPLDFTLGKFAEGGYDGVGIGLFDGISGIDIDHHRDDDGTLDEFAKGIVSAIDAFTEVSPTGDGVHVLFNASEFTNKHTKSSYKECYYFNRSRYNGLEVYPSGLTNKFFTLTGEVLANGSAGDKSDALVSILDEHMQRMKPRKPNDGETSTRRKCVEKSDDALILKARSSKRNGDKFTRLWDGDTSEYRTVNEHGKVNEGRNEADQALCNMLTWWTNHDMQRVDALFRQSGLYREKWEREDYRTATLAKSDADVSGGYDPVAYVKKKRAEEEVRVDAEFWSACPYLEYKDNGEYKNPNVAAITWILESCPNFDGICYDEMNETIVCMNGVPWDRKNHPLWVESDYGRMLEYLQKEIRMYEKAIVTSGGNANIAIENVASKRSFNRCTEILESLPQWDGELRADNLLIDFLGAEDTDYTKSCTGLMLHGAYARAYHPGCKFDLMVILKSTHQGIGKSTLLNKLAMDDTLFTDSVKGIGSKDAQEIIQGSWIVEFADLETFRKTEVNALKNFITQRYDKYRAAYARRATARPRRCILVGTTNDDTYLSDPTGNRRFLPVVCEGQRKLDVMLDLTPQYVQQVWAEVKATHDDGKPLVLRPELEAEAEEHRSHATIEEPWFGLVQSYLADKKHTYHCNLELLRNAVGFDGNDRPTQRDQQRMGSIMARMPGWEKVQGLKTVTGFGRQRAYRYTG